MNIKMFAIGWDQPSNTGDVYVGAVTDTTTAHSLLDLVESKGGYAVSLHGNGISGEYSIKDARKLFVSR